jgi:predicted dehydrogenase
MPKQPPTNRPIQVSLIGCGAVSEQFYAPALTVLEKSGVLSVVALVDPKRDRTACLRRFFPKAAASATADNLSGGENALAIVASPVRFHAEHTIDALKRGMAVLCEKPMAMTAAQGEAMIETASAQRRLLAVGHFRRFFPATQTIHALLAARTFGNVESFNFSEGVNFNWPAQSASFFKRDTGGGGVTIDMGAHAFDLLYWWFGAPRSLVYEDDAMGGVEANCRLFARFNDGVSGEVRLSRDWELPNRYFIQCERGWMSWNVGEAERVQIGFNDSPYAIDGQLFQSVAAGHYKLMGASGANYRQSFVLQIKNVIASMRGEEELRVAGAAGLDNIRLIEKCYRTRKLMVMPWLSDGESRRAVELAK